MTSASVPYAETYGLAPAQRTTVGAFVREHMNASARRGTARDPAARQPPYVFDAQVLHREPDLAAGVPLPGLLAEHPAILTQFILGPAGSGAYPHFHNLAANALVHGRKRWWLFRPGDAFFDLQHIQAWIDGGGASASGAMECTQNAGEVFVIPDNWGHAVVNERDSIAVAFELHSSSIGAG